MQSIGLVLALPDFLVVVAVGLVFDLLELFLSSLCLGNFSLYVLSAGLYVCMYVRP